MKSLFRMSLMTALVAGFMAFTAASAQADPVQFSTAGTFSNCAPCTGSGTSTVQFLASAGNGFRITFVGVSSLLLNTPVDASFGLFDVDVLGTGYNGASGDFSLTITQTTPPGGAPGSFSATFTGSFQASNSGGGLVTFSTTSLTISTPTGTRIYSITNNPLTLVVPDSGNDGKTTVQGHIVAVPEPASMLLLGTGLAGIAGVARRKLRVRH